MEFGVAVARLDYPSVTVVRWQCVFPVRKFTGLFGIDDAVAGRFWADFFGHGKPHIGLQRHANGVVDFVLVGHISAGSISWLFACGRIFRDTGV